MSDTLKHILLAFGAAVIALGLQIFTGIVPAAYQPFVALAVGYFAHYYLENAPAGSPVLNLGAPPTGPPATPLLTSAPPASNAASQTATV